ncbi:hypothetical protein HZA97_00755 [Candidatus Woesearchaeota archaeon]|nr:hypothetical protein [Candidatus Woesearchaeota archaeon]
MSLTDKVKNYFFGTKIARDYNYTRENLAKKIKDPEHLREQQRTVSFLKFIDVGVCKYAPNLVSASSLVYGIHTKNVQLIVWGLFFGEGSRMLYGHFHKSLRKNAGILEASEDYGKANSQENNWWQNG